jgi:GNAT superfamily N-acetyltransferase
VPQLLSFPKHQVPRDIAIQIRSYVAVQWPHLYGTSGELWPFTGDNPKQPTAFCLMEGEVLISHAEANRRGIIRFGDQDLICWGVSSVFTYPAWRGSGLAKEVVRAAAQHINASDGDIGLLFTGKRLRNFYSQCGWIPMDTTRVLYGDAQNPKQDQTGQIMMLFPSEQGRVMQPRLLEEPLFVGPVTW